MPILLPFVLLGCRSPCPGNWERYDARVPGRYPYEITDEMARFTDASGTWTWPDGSVTPATLSLTRVEGWDERLSREPGCSVFGLSTRATLSIATNDGRLAEVDDTRSQLTWSRRDDNAPALSPIVSWAGRDPRRRHRSWRRDRDRRR